MKKKPSPRLVWVSKGCGDDYAINISAKRPKKRIDDDGKECGCIVVTGDTVVSNLCSMHFEPMTGIKLKPGECKRFLWRSPLLPVPKRKKAAAKKG